VKHLTPPPEDSKQGAPAYITTFSDMVTLLLTFFVLLLSLSKLQDAGLIAAARDSFVQRLTSLGLRGVLYGRNKPVEFDKFKMLYSVEKPEQSDERTLDAKEAEIQELYQKLTKTVDALTPQVIGAKVAYLPKNIHFGPGQIELDSDQKELLSRDMARLAADLSERDVRIYVVGLARDELTEKSGWVVSAQRAEAVAACMRDMLPEGLGWQIYSWGVGDGGEWVSEEGQMAKESDILVAVLRQKQ